MRLIRGAGRPPRWKCAALWASAVKNGWKPRRTLLYASWDAEEYGLVGSTEWAEENARSIDEKAVLMLNVDSAVSGPELEMSAACRRCATWSWTRPARSPTHGPARRCARPGPKRAGPPGPRRRPSSLTDPVWDSTAPQGDAGWNAKRRLPPSSRRRWAGSGSGSDYTAFVDHLAVPAVDAGFKGGYGVYHSIYDDFNWMEKFGDPEFLTHATAARLYTLIVMRAASADVVPLKFVPYGRALREHVDELRTVHAHRVRKSDPANFKGETEIAGSAQPGRGRARVSGQGRGARPGHRRGGGARRSGPRRPG